MYVGRFVVAGRTQAGMPYLAYRVSSRSFPSRRIVAREDRAMVVPTEDAPPTDNPYVSYNCLRRYQETVLVANGSHVDPAIDKISLGFGVRDAMALSLLALDYEHDSYNTPRIIAGLEADSGAMYLGIVGESRLSVERVDVTPGEALLVATYEAITPTPIALQGETPQVLCDAVYECAYEHPVAALVCSLVEDDLPIATRGR